MTIANWFAWCTHAAILIAVGIGSARLFAWRHPHSRLRYFQLLLAASVMLPLLEPRRAPPRPPVSGGFTVVRSGPVSTAPTAALDWQTLLPWLVAGGTLLVLTHLGVGLLRLRALRRRGRSITIDGVTGIDIREVNGLRGPAAFGWLRPVILLPPGLAAGPLRDAAVRHELQHVIRRDWLENMIERAAASILWFHPAVWWLLERIHLTREQAVDLEVAGAGGERDAYLQTLLASAGLANLPSLPATSFIRRPRHLVERVAFLTKETTMTIRATAASAALALLVSGAALTLSALYLPLQLSAQEETPAADSPLHWTRFSRASEGTVQVEATVNGEGEVIDARVVSGPDELRKQAIQSVLAWRYTKDAAARRILPVTIDFKIVSGAIRGVSGGVVGGIIGGVPLQSPPVEEATFEGVDYQGLSTELQQRAAGVMAGVQSGQKLTRAQIDQLRAGLTAIDASLTLSQNLIGTPQGATLRLGVSKQSPMPPKQIRIGAKVQEANLISRVDPVYPPLARQARIQGTVRFTIIVGKDGSVENAQLVSGHPLLVQAAQDALRQFKYRPTLLNGDPISVQTSVDIDFVL